mgnify:CR=1 FL=1
MGTQALAARMLRRFLSVVPACEDIAWMKGQKVVAPADGLYHPQRDVTRRAMTMTVYLYRMTHAVKTAPPCTSKPFTDVSVTNTFCGAITWMKGTGITGGIGDGMYAPVAT